MTIMFSTIILTLFYISSIKRKIFESYLKLFSLTWLCIVIGYYFSQSMFVPVSEKFDYVFSLFLIFNYLSYFIFRFFFDLIPKVRLKKILSYRHLFMFSLILLVYCLCKFIAYYSLSGSFESLRANVLNEGWSFGVGIAFPFSAGCYFYCRVNNLNRYSYFFLFSMLTLAIISTAKMFFIILMLYVSGLYLKDFKISVLRILVFIIIGFLLFSAIHLIMNKVSHKFPDSIILSLIYTLTGYFFGGFGVFQLALSGQYNDGLMYKNLFDFLTDNWIQVSTITEGGWVYTGSWLGNVESGFTPWYLFSGDLGIIWLGVFMGAIYAFIFSFSIKFEEMIFLRVFSIYPLVFLVFYDTLMHSFTTWIGFLTISIILTITKPIKRSAA